MLKAPAFGRIWANRKFKRPPEFLTEFFAAGATNAACFPLPDSPGLRLVLRLQIRINVGNAIGSNDLLKDLFRR